MAKEEITAEDLSEDELRTILIQLDVLTEKEKHLAKIETDDQLHKWIKDEFGVDIPRVAVCPDHDAPFDFIADLFFKRVDSALVMANRGAGKSYLAGLWSVISSYWEPGVESLHVGAIEIQAKRVYSHVKQFQNQLGKEHIESTSITETLWKNMSKVEIVTGSLSSVNGPHSQHVHRDEIELMDKQVYQESLQIERAKTIDDREIPSQTLITSTRKASDGLMQELLDECALAEAEGRRPPFKVYKFCIKECVKRVPNCQVAFPDLPDEEKCDCHELENGEFSDGSKRTFDKVCMGAFAKSDGFIPLDDAQKTFSKSGKAIWEAQQECKRPYVEDITLPEFSREQHGIQGFELDPSNGPVYMGIDFGGTNPHAVEWIQVLDYELEVLDFKGDPKRLQEGTRILFNEIYRAEIGNTKLADMISEIEKQYKRQYPKFRVKGRFADPQAKAARLDFRDHDPPLMCSWPAVTRDKEEHAKRLRDVIVDDLFVVCLDECPMFVEEVEVWNINLPRKKFDHAVDATLYGVSNIYVIEQTRARRKPELPGADKHRHIGTNPNPFDDNLPTAVPSPLHSTVNATQSKWD